ncbi:MAG: hypothetical protein KA419_01730 [Acidobacteria bacterium]|nr:hypothetical protein [Acidobacteriota bacterium]
MHIPKGKTVHKELSSSFVDFGKFLEELKKSSFSGLVELIGVKGEVEVLLDFGDVSNVRIQAGEVKFGRDLIVEALRMASAENMLISSFCLPAESVALISCFLQGQKIYENLTSEFTDPEKLIAKYEQEKGEYCVEAIFTKNYGCGLVFLQEGHVVEALLSILDKDLTTGKPAVKEIVDGARELGATFNVYKGKIEATTAPAAGPVLPPAEVHAVIETLIAEFEKMAAKGARKDFNFDAFLRESCLQVADQHPFLDPFAAEFLYKGGKMELNTVEPPHKVVDGVFRLILSMGERLQQSKQEFSREEYRKAVQAALAGHEYVASELLVNKHLNDLVGK